MLYPIQSSKYKVASTLKKVLCDLVFSMTDHPCFLSHITQICLCHSEGVKKQ